jgi:hypothetical protein
MLQLAKHVHAKFQLSSFYPDGQIFGNFTCKFQNFHKKISKFPNSEKNPNKASKRHLLTKFKQSSIFTKITKVILNCFDSRVCSRDFKILGMRCINPAQLTKGSQNLKSVALKTAEISSTHILTKD